MAMSSKNLIKRGQRNDKWNSGPALWRRE